MIKERERERERKGYYIWLIIIQFGKDKWV